MSHQIIFSSLMSTFSISHRIIFIHIHHPPSKLTLVCHHPPPPPPPPQIPFPGRQTHDPDRLRDDDDAGAPGRAPIPQLDDSLGPIPEGRSGLPDARLLEGPALPLYRADGQRLRRWVQVYGLFQAVSVEEEKCFCPSETQ